MVFSVALESTPLIFRIVHFLVRSSGCTFAMKSSPMRIVTEGSVVSPGALLALCIATVGCVVGLVSLAVTVAMQWVACRPWEAGLKMGGFASGCMGVDRSLFTGEWGDREGKFLVIGGVSAGVSSKREVTARFLCVAGKLLSFKVFNSMFFGFLVQFLLRHDEQFTSLLKQTQFVQSPLLHVQQGFLVGVGVSRGSSIVAV